MYSGAEGGEAILHIISNDALPEHRAGVIDHMAFSATGLLETLDKLKARNIDSELRRLPDSGVWQLFFLDPNGAKVELDFEASEPGPA